ncbi:MAG TPA: transposase [Verrucomicrobiae bacterium]
MKTHPTAQTFGCFDVELRMQWLEKSNIRARIEHVFGLMSQSMKRFYLRCTRRRRNAAAIGLINLIYNMARYEQIVRSKLLPRNAPENDD